MDLSFTLRRRKSGAPKTPDLDSLLSTAAARAATTPTARTSARLEGDALADAQKVTDPHVAIFADGKPSVPSGGSFAEVPQATVTSGKER